MECGKELQSSSRTEKYEEKWRLNLHNFQSPHWLEYLKIELRMNLKMTQSILTNEILKIKKI